MKKIKLNAAAALGQMNFELKRELYTTKLDPQCQANRISLDNFLNGYIRDDFMEQGKIFFVEFADEYRLYHGAELTDADYRLLIAYMFVNRLHPMLMENWNEALRRLEAEELIPIRVRQAPVEEKPAGRQWVDIEKIDDRTPEGKRRLRVALFNNMLIEAEPVVDKFFADLESRGQYPTHEQRLQLAKWVENHNLFPHQRQSWERALSALFPQYLTAEDKALRELDRDDITSADLKRALGTANPRLTVASQNVRGK